MERRVVVFAAASRAAVTLVALLTARLVTPYDTSTRLAAGGVGPYAAAFANWDGVYFTQIATQGYDYEQVHAFFPLYPLLMRALRCVQSLLQADLPYEGSQRHCIHATHCSSVLSLLALPSRTIASGWLIRCGTSHETERDI